jgi:hypothetical protein
VSDEGSAAAASGTSSDAPLEALMREQLTESLELEYRLSQCLQRYSSLKAENTRLLQAAEDAEKALHDSEVSS